jgi:geranylgeranyl pyrophosphate synthase
MTPGAGHPRGAGDPRAELEAWRARAAQAVDRALGEALARRPADWPAVAGLWEAMGYTALGGGKRLRGVLALASAEAAGGEELDGLPAAAALELIHAYSLIHDDLPALDDDQLRRGLPTNHVVHGEALAILAGDALQSLAFEVLADAPAPPARALAAVKVLAEAIGLTGMAGGQAMDLALENSRPELEAVLAMESLKTGRLISAAMAMGAILGGGSEETVGRLASAGLTAGLAFQIKDDLLNHSGDPALMGKSVGTDAERGKASSVSLMGPAEAAALADAKAREAAAAIAGLGSAKLDWLLGLMVSRDR